MLAKNSNNNYTKNIKQRRILPTILIAEMWERFSFYGMQALLALFLTRELNMSDSNSYAIISIYISVCYAGPVLSGFIADKLLGAKTMVLIGGIILIIGHAAMSMVVIDHYFTFIGLGLISIGTGAFKGNITNLLGQVYEGENNKKDHAFTLFHVSVNVGSALAAIICGFIGENEAWGWHYGFGIAAIGMTIGLLIFVNAKDSILAQYGNPPDKLRAQQKFYGISLQSLVFLGLLALSILVMVILQFAESFINPIRLLSLIVFGFFVYFISLYKDEAMKFKNLIAFGIMLFFFMCFIIMELQIFSLLSVFIDRSVDRNVFGVHIPASVFQSINPISIILFGWFLAQFFKKTSPEFAVTRILIALLMMATSFYMIYLGCFYANDKGLVSWTVPLIAIAFMGVSEIFIAPLIQMQATTLTPQGTRGFMIGVTMISLSVASLAGYEIQKIMALPDPNAVNAKLDALEIYKNGFLKVTIVNLLISISFLPFYPFLRKTIKNNAKFEVEALKAKNKEGKKN